VLTGASREVRFTVDVILREGAPRNEQAEETRLKSLTRSSPKTVRRFFPKLENGDVVEFCERQLVKLSKLVEECESRFP